MASLLAMLLAFSPAVSPAQLPPSPTEIKRQEAERRAAEAEKRAADAEAKLKSLEAELRRVKGDAASPADRTQASSGNVGSYDDPKRSKLPDSRNVSLGRMLVLSSRGSPIVAEISINGVSYQQAVDQVAAEVAPPAAHKTSGIEFDPALVGASVRVELDTGGRPVLRLVGMVPTKTPMVDVLLFVRLGRQRVSRSYTLLLD